MTDARLREELITLGRKAAEPVHDLLIAGEGNLSGPTGRGTILVTTSGARLGALGDDDLVEVSTDDLVEAIDGIDSDAAWLEAVLATRIDISARRPSVEVGLHGAIRALAGDVYILHAHPAAILSVLGSADAADFARARLIPDHVVGLGRADLLLAYADPGRVLAGQVRDGMTAHRARHGELPVSILVANHGAFVTGASPREALDRMLMLTKMARVFSGGGVVGMPTTEIDRIASREDEAYRRALLAR
jgi:rhamnose utilization protein RhaD (predicted bifunctional aldolase and dehydrogenase)